MATAQAHTAVGEEAAVDGVRPGAGQVRRLLRVEDGPPWRRPQAGGWNGRPVFRFSGRNAQMETVGKRPP